MFGLIILVIGVVLLLRNLGYIDMELWNIIWPCIWIIVGLKFMLKGKKHGHKHGCWCCGQGHKGESERE